MNLKMSIFRIVGLLAVVMIGIYTAWEVAETTLKSINPASDLAVFYFLRGITTAAIMSALAAWLMLRHRRQYEAVHRESEKELEARLIQAEKLAAIGEAAASIAHEVRNALAGISGTVQVLKRSAAWKELPEGLSEEFDLQVTRIAHIVNDLMSYARPGTLHTSRTNLHTVLARVLASAAPVAEAEGKKIESRFSPEDLRALVDAGRMEQAFSNLVINALQAMERGGRLRVTTDRKDERIRIRFQDTGCGMPEETKLRAFEPFFTTKVRGTGLGLPIVRTIVEAHNGAVDLASEPGSGTTVTLILPAEPQSRVQEEVQMKRKNAGVRVAVAALVAVLGLTGGLLLAEGYQYVGVAKCKTCHMSEHKIWMESKHAGAFDKLKPEEQTKAECLSCHTTGQGKPAAEGADMKGVQCEACHGPGSEYKNMKIMSKKAYADDPAGARKASLAAGLTLPDEKTCLNCHNAKSPNFKGFDFAASKEKIKHWD